LNGRESKMRYLYRRVLFYVVLIALPLSVILVSDIMLGYWDDTSRKRQMSSKFRSEADYLWLNTKYIKPSVNHAYKTGKEEIRRYRTNTLGVIKGPDDADTMHKASIVFMGGSTTETNEVNEEYRFPYLAGKLVTDKAGDYKPGINLGVRGNTAIDSVNLLINHPAIEGVEYAVLMHNINDRLLLSIRDNYYATLVSENNISVESSIHGMIGSIGAFLESLSYVSNIGYLIRHSLFNIDAWTGEGNVGYVKKNWDILWEDPVDYANILEDAVTYAFYRDMDVSVYNLPLCVLPESIWTFARKSISDYKNIYLQECDACDLKEHCSGLFSSSETRHSRGIKAVHMDSDSVAKVVAQA